MKSPWLVGIVIAIAAHVCVVSLVLLAPGCGTLTEPEMAKTDDPIVVMPPKEIVEVDPPPMTSITPPTVATWPETTSYLVQKGDSLSVIANRFDLTVTEIASVNGITDYDKIFAGQKLALPGKIDIKAAPPPAPAPAAPPKKKAAPLAGNEYEVQKGDTLSHIAVRFGIKTKDLKQANNLTSDKIIVGQRLAIPGKTATAGRPAPPLRPPVKPPVKEVATPVKAVEPEPPKVPEVSLDAEPLTVPKVENKPAANAGAAAGTGTALSKTHVVEEDEDLYSIAMLWQVSPKRIKEVNGMENDEVKTGQKLKIPLAD